MKDRACRRCGVALTLENARAYQNRWTGACRSCESIEANTRKTGRPPVHARGTCNWCDLVKAVNPTDGTLRLHRDAEGNECPGTGSAPLRSAS